MKYILKIFSLQICIQYAESSIQQSFSQSLYVPGSYVENVQCKKHLHTHTHTHTQTHTCVCVYKRTPVKYELKH